jgi:hypothetical protein
MRTNAYRAALDLLAWLACAAGSIGATVLALTHPAAFDIHQRGLYLDAFAAALGLAVLVMLDRATDRLAWATYRRGDVERCATCGEPVGPNDDAALVHREHAEAESVPLDAA